MAKARDWDKVEDFLSAIQDNSERDPREYRHGLLVQDPPSMFSWGFYWFASPEERVRFIVRAHREEVEMYDNDEDYEGVQAEAESLGGGPMNTCDVQGLPGVLGGRIEWIGSLDHLMTSDEDFCRQVRRDFWRRHGRDEPSIPAELVEGFLDELHMG